MNLAIEPYLSHACFFTNASYNCPKLALWGYSTQRALQAAIRRKLKALSTLAAIRKG